MKRSLRTMVPFYAGLGLLVAAGCSSSEASSSLPTVTIGPQSYSHRAPATTTTTISIEEAEPGDVVHEEQEYVVQPNDGLSQIAAIYEVTAEKVAAYNGFTAGVNERIDPGQTILIPPGAIYVDEEMLNATTTSAPLAGEDVATSVAPETTPPTSQAPPDETTAEDDSDCVAGTYVIEPSDTSRLAVAEQFDVTVEALDAANAETAGYSSFYPGLEILIPESSDC